MLKPLKRVDLAPDGIALPDRVTNVVTNRPGSILSDFFTNLQKMTLLE